MNWSVVYAAILSPIEKATALQGSCDLKVNRSLPEATSHSLTEESADAVMSFSESPASCNSKGGPRELANFAGCIAL